MVGKKKKSDGEIEMFCVPISVYDAIIKSMEQRTTLEPLHDALQDLDEKVRSGALVPPTTDFKATLAVIWKAYLEGKDPEKIRLSDARIKELKSELITQYERFLLTVTTRDSSLLDAVAMKPLNSLMAFVSSRASCTPPALREVAKEVQKAGEGTLLELTGELFEKVLDAADNVRTGKLPDSVKKIMKSVKGKMEQVFYTSDEDLEMRNAWYYTTFDYVTRRLEAERHSKARAAQVSDTVKSEVTEHASQFSVLSACAAVLACGNNHLRQQARSPPLAHCVWQWRLLAGALLLQRALAAAATARRGR